MSIREFCEVAHILTHKHNIVYNMYNAWCDIVVLHTSF